MLSEVAVTRLFFPHSCVQNNDVENLQQETVTSFIHTEIKFQREILDARN